MNRYFVSHSRRRRVKGSLEPGVILRRESLWRYHSSLFFPSFQVTVDLVVATVSMTDKVTCSQFPTLLVRVRQQFSRIIFRNGGGRKCTALHLSSSLCLRGGNKRCPYSPLLFIFLIFLRFPEFHDRIGEDSDTRLTCVLEYNLVVVALILPCRHFVALCSTPDLFVQ